MVQASTFRPVLDRARQAMYAAAFVVAIGSLWTIAWANSIDDHGKPPMLEADHLGAVSVVADDAVPAPAEPIAK